MQLPANGAGIIGTFDFILHGPLSISSNVLKLAFS